MKINGVPPLTPQPIARTQATDAAYLSLGKSVKNSIDRFQNSGVKNDDLDIANLQLRNRRNLSLDNLLKECMKKKEKSQVN
jgi:hypothetical protein